MDSKKSNKAKIGKIFPNGFGIDIHTFDPDDVLEEMVEAQEGTVFVLGTRHTHTEGAPEDDNEVEITFAQIKKVRSK